MYGATAAILACGLGAEVRGAVTGTPKGAGPQSLWPTPVAAFRLPGLSDPGLRARLAARGRRILAKQMTPAAAHGGSQISLLSTSPSGVFAGQSLRTDGGRFIDECAQDRQGHVAKDCIRLRELLVAAVQKYLVDALKHSPSLASTVAVGIDESWMNIRGPGAYDSPHVHPMSGIAGTYYLECGSVGDATGASGASDASAKRRRAEAAQDNPYDADSDDVARCAVALEDPRTPAATADLEKELRERLGFGVPQIFNLSPGSVLIHPSWLVHAAVPHSGEGHRIAISFTVAVQSRPSAKVSSARTPQGKASLDEEL